MTKKKSPRGQLGIIPASTQVLAAPSSRPEPGDIGNVTG
jgi:hypothetical protein